MATALPAVPHLTTANGGPLRAIEGHLLEHQARIERVCTTAAGVVGGFHRVPSGGSQTDNLNAPAMHFEPLAFAEPCNTPSGQLVPDAGANRFYAYGVIARLALVAAAREIAGTGT